MTTLAMYTPDSRVIDLASLTPSDYQLIGSLHGQVKRGDRVLVCLQGGVDNGEMYIRQVKGKYWAAHFPGEGHGEHVIAMESDEHRRQKDYWYRAAEDSGYGAAREVRTENNTIVDVAIYGSRSVGIEVQRSPIAPRSIRSRTTKTFRAGLLPVWFTDAEKSPHWLHKVPSLGCNRLPWDHLPQRRAATATGLRKIEAVPCRYDTFGVCPDGRPRPCGKFHPSPEPLGGLTVDDVAAMVPSGSLVPLTTRKGHIYLVTPSSVALYRDLTGLDGTFEPGTPARETSKRREHSSKECRNPSHGDEEIGELLLADADDSVGQDNRYRCGCGELLIAHVSQQRGFCERCRLAGREALNLAKVWRHEPGGASNSYPPKTSHDLSNS